MKAINYDTYQIGQLVASLSKAFDRENIKYKQIVEDLLKIGSIEMVRLIKKLKKKHTGKSHIPSSLEVSKFEESINRDKVITEGIFDWLKSFYDTVINSFKKIRTIKNKIQGIMSKIGME